MTTKRRCLLLFASCLAIGGATFASGNQMIAYQFEATVHSMFEYDGDTQAITVVTHSDMAGAGVSVGHSLTGSFSYDRDATPSPFDPPGDQSVVYLPIGGHLTFVTQGGLAAGFNDSLAAVVSDNLFGSTDSFFLSANTLEAGLFRSAYVSFVDLSGSLYSGFALPGSLELSDFNASTMHFAFLRQSDGDQLQFDAQITKISKEAPVVPEELSTLHALVLSVVSLGGARAIRNQFRVTSRSLGVE